MDEIKAAELEVADAADAPQGQEYFLCDDPGFWSFNGDILIGHHKIPRFQLFVPTEQNCPLPLKYLDVTRTTNTSLDSATAQGDVRLLEHAV